MQPLPSHGDVGPSVCAESSEEDIIVQVVPHADSTKRDAVCAECSASEEDIMVQVVPHVDSTKRNAQRLERNTSLGSANSLVSSQATLYSAASEVSRPTCTRSASILLKSFSMRMWSVSWQRHSGKRDRTRLFMISSFVLSSLGTAALVSHVYMFTIHDDVCNLSQTSADVLIHGMPLYEFISRQLLMNVIVILLMAPPIIKMLLVAKTNHEWWLTTYAIAGYYYTMFCIMQYCFQLSGWCSTSWVPSLWAAVFALASKVVTPVMVYYRVAALEHAMLQRWRVRFMRAVAVLCAICCIVVYLRLVFMPKPGGVAWWLSMLLEWSTLAGIWLFMIVATRSFTLAAKYIKSTLKTLDRTDDNLEDIEMLEVALRTCEHQRNAVLFSYGSLAAFATMWRMSNGLHPFPRLTSYTEFMVFSSLPDTVDIFFNIIASLYFMSDNAPERASLREKENEEHFRATKLRKFRACAAASSNREWQEVVEDLAGRGVSLRALLEFYKRLGTDIMPQFDPYRSTTADVARAAVIPLSSSKGCAYATIMMEGKRVVPETMVSHNWGSRFADLLSAIIADALGDDTFEWTFRMLSQQPDKLCSMLERAGLLDKTFWVCAFAVNQHASICHSSRSCDTVTGLKHQTCSCTTPKYSNTCDPVYQNKSIKCQMNKFDDMMAHLTHQNKNFRHLIAVDRGFAIFTRAWVVAEIVLAFGIGLQEHFVLFNASDVRKHQSFVDNLSVEDMQAARPEDVAEIMSKIENTQVFNVYLQENIRKKMRMWRTLDLKGKLRYCGRLARG